MQVSQIVSCPTFVLTRPVEIWTVNERDYLVDLPNHVSSPIERNVEDDPEYKTIVWTRASCYKMTHAPVRRAATVDELIGARDQIFFDTRPKI